MCCHKVCTFIFQYVLERCKNKCKILFIKDSNITQGCLFLERCPPQDITNWCVIYIVFKNRSMLTYNLLEYFKMVENIVINTDEMNM